MKQFECVQLRNLVESITSGSSASQTSEGVDTVPVTRIESLGDGFLKPENLGYVAREDISNEHRMHKGDILFSNINSLSMIGKCVRVRTNDLPVFVGMNTLRIRPNRRLVDDNYLFWAIYSDFVKGQARAYAKPAINQASLPQSSIKALQIPHPPLEAQRAIADFLDRETAEIDAFIADQERLIELLTERRTATITHAVTKGLDPSAPMRDSGIPWLGHIPAHWQLGKLRHFADLKTGHTPSRQKPEYWKDCSIKWFTLADVWQLRQGNKYFSQNTENISELGLANSAAELLPSGTVVLSRTASVGFTGILDEPSATSQDYWNWVPKQGMNSEYLWYLLQALNPYIRSLMQGSTHKTIYKGDAVAFEGLLPPKEEQDLIVRWLESRVGSIESLIADARRAIELSKERRAALISAAVTGQIEVRTHA